MLIADGLLVLSTLIVPATPTAQPPRPFAGISFRPLAEPHKIQIELHTKGENSYRVTLRVEGETRADVREVVTKELRRRHWDVEPKRDGLVMVYGFKPAEGPTEPITGITITMWANQPGVPPPYPGIGHGEGVRAKVLIQMEPGPALEEKP